MHFAQNVDHSSKFYQIHQKLHFFYFSYFLDYQSLMHFV